MTLTFWVWWIKCKCIRLPDERTNVKKKVILCANKVKVQISFKSKTDFVSHIFMKIGH